MTADCLRIDDYLDGRLSGADAEAFETHALACDTCDDALEASLDLSPLLDETCPPAVVEAALRAARRAPDRAPDRSLRRAPVLRLRPRLRIGGVVFALAAAVALAVWVAPLPGAPPASIAEGPRVATPPVETLPIQNPPVQDPPVQDPPSPPPLASAPVAAPLPQPAPRRPIADPPVHETADPAPELLVEGPDSEAPGPLDDPSPEAIAEAQRDLALAFHLVAEAQTQAGRAVRASAGPATTAFDHALPF